MSSTDAALSNRPAGAIEVTLLMVTHVVAAGIVVWLLERLVRA